MTKYQYDDCLISKPHTGCRLATPYVDLYCGVEVTLEELACGKLLSNKESIVHSEGLDWHDQCILACLFGLLQINLRSDVIIIINVILY